MADISVTFAGRKLRNPLGVASHALTSPEHDPQALADHLNGYVEAGAAFVYTPFINPEARHPKGFAPAYKFMGIGSREPFGREGLLVATDAERIMSRLDDGLKLIDLLKKSLPADVPVIANIIGPGSDASGWGTFAKKFEDAGADIIEMNVSCPIPACTADAVGSYASGEMPSSAGSLLGDSPALLEPVVQAVVDAVSIPVGVKMTPETGFPRLVGVAEAIQRGGAQFISGINAPLTCSPPDIYNDGKAKWPGIEDHMLCAALGPWDRFLNYRNLTTLSMFVPGMALCSIGGLVEPEHVVEAMMLGGRVCQLSSGLFWRGTDLITDSLTFLNDYMDQMGYKSTDEFIGRAIAHMKPVEDIDWRMEEFVSWTDDRKCRRCGICSKGICSARILKENPLRVEVNEDMCYGCGLCEAVCPEHAISILEKKHKVIGVSFMPSH
ncbi:MAG: 4Fe-4S binding protein [Gaiellales bacterium]|nr:4Fe-4S binding protein [Gaiellales bacterium]